MPGLCPQERDFMEIGCTEGQGCNSATAQSLRELRLAAFCRRDAGAGTTLTVTKQVAIARRERRARARASSVFAQYGRG